MARISSDELFARRGRPLAYWLLELVSPDADRRASASTVFHDIWWEGGDAAGMSDDAYQAAFKAEVEAVLLNPEFPGAEVVRALLTIAHENQEEWKRLVPTIMKPISEAISKVCQQAGVPFAYPDEPREPARRPSIDEEFEDAEDTGGAVGVFVDTMAVDHVLDAIGRAVVLVPETIRYMLGDPEIDRRNLAIKLINQAGPEGMRAFRADLFPSASSELLTGKEDYVFIEAIIGNAASDPGLLGRVCDQIEAEMVSAATGDVPEYHDLVAGQGEYAYWWLGHILKNVGPAAREMPGVGTRVVPLLKRFSRSRHPGHRAAAALALGGCARGDAPQRVAEVVDRLLELSHEHAAVAGYVLDAIAELVSGSGGDPAAGGIEPTRVVPRLIEMIGVYDEQDCDTPQDQRLCRTIALFGKAAASASPRLRLLHAHRGWTQAVSTLLYLQLSRPRFAAELEADALGFLIMRRLKIRRTRQRLMSIQFAIDESDDARLGKILAAMSPSVVPAAGKLRELLDTFRAEYDSGHEYEEDDDLYNDVDDEDDEEEDAATADGDDEPFFHTEILKTLSIIES